jgi:hypothetical protein
MSQQDRIISLQRQVKIARVALARIKSGTHSPEHVADEALDEMWRLDPKQPLQGVVGHAPRI